MALNTNVVATSGLPNAVGIFYDRNLLSRLELELSFDKPATKKSCRRTLLVISPSLATATLLPIPLPSRTVRCRVVIRCNPRRSLPALRNMVTTLRCRTCCSWNQLILSLKARPKCLDIKLVCRSIRLSATRLTET
jgi:hypothetical protein